MIFATAGVKGNRSEPELDYHHEHRAHDELAGLLSV